MRGRGLGGAVKFEAALPNKGGALITIDHTILVPTAALDIIRIHRGEGLLLLVDIQDEGVHRQG